MTYDHLKRLLDLLRCSGVQYYEDESVKLQLYPGPPPAPESSMRPSSPEAEAPANPDDPSHYDGLPSLRKRRAE